MLASLRFIDHRREGELGRFASRRLSLVVFQGLLHASRHLRRCVAFLSGFMDTLKSSFLLLAHLFPIDADTAEVRHSIRFERRALAVAYQAGFRVILLCHSDLLTLPKIERLLALLSDLNRLLFHFQPSRFISITDLLVAWNEDGSWNRLMTELVLDHVLLFNLLLHNHFVDFLLACACLLGLIVPHLEGKRLGNGDAISAPSERFLPHLMHVIISRNALLV